MSGKYALIIGNTEYIDPGLAELTAPGKDAEDFARVLKNRDICAFDDVKVLLNQPSFTVGEAIDEFFDQKKPDDLLVLYFSGHGVRDQLGALYLAVKNTNHTRLRFTAIRSDNIREAMDQSRSKRQVLILDCCYSGAFPQGTKGGGTVMMGMTQAFQGYGRFVLTASDAIQLAWEGDRVIGETDNSLFTHFLVKGLEGEADQDGDGSITVDELYDYAFEQISRATPKQTPTKSAARVEGEIVLRQITRIEDIKPITLPDDLISEIDDLRPYVREAAVQKLEKIVKGKNIGMARSAMEALEKIATDDNTTRRVSQIATQVLESVRQAEQKAAEERRAKEEAERLAALRAEEERLAREKAEAERKAKEEVARIANEEKERLLAEQKAEEERKAKMEAERLLEEKRPTEAEQRVEQQRKAKQEAERLAILKAEEDRLAREKLAPERKAEAKTDAKNKTVKKAEHEEFVYVIVDDGIPLYKSLPASNNWSVLLPKKSKLSLINTNDARKNIGKYGHYVEVTDRLGNQGFVAAHSISIKYPTSKEIEEERTAQAITEGVIPSAEGKTFNKQAIMIWIILGTAIGGAVGGVFAWAISGAICGLAIAIALQNEQILSTPQNLLWIVLAWTIGAMIGWQIDFRMPTGGYLTGGLVSWIIGGLTTAIILRMEKVLSQEQSMIQITLVWAIAGGIGWLLGGSIGGLIGWAIGWGVGGAIGGSVMVWNIRRT